MKLNLKPKRTIPLEATVEEYLRKAVKKYGGIAYKFNSPARRSVPDRIIVLPNGVLHFIEMKTIGGKVSPGQRREIARLRRLGHTVYVIWTKAGVDKYIRSLP